VKNPDENKLVNDTWKKLIVLYIKQKQTYLNDPSLASSLENEIRKIRDEAINKKKEVEFEEDEDQLLKYCQAFYDQTLSYQKDF